MHIIKGLFLNKVANGRFIHWVLRLLKGDAYLNVTATLFGTESQTNGITVVIQQHVITKCFDRLYSQEQLCRQHISKVHTTTNVYYK